MKTCTKCAGEKTAEEFFKDSTKVDGLYSSCKQCVTRTTGGARLKAAARWRRRNPERMRAYKKNAYVPHPRPPKDLTAPRRAKTAWKRRNPAKVVADKAKRRARELRATPFWANLFFIKEAYDLAYLRTKATGFKWHVDHIVPLRSRLVCGLHVENNLRVIPAAQNVAKSNRHWPDMPQALAV